MWNHIINIHPSQLLSTKTKKCRINESYKKKVLHNKKLTKYKNDYEQYLNYINKNYIMHLNVYL